MTNYEKVEVLEQKHSLKILLILSDGPLYKGELASKITIGTASVQARVEDLKSIGLVNEESLNVKPFKKIVSLTPEGEQIASYVKAINDHLNKHAVDTHGISH